MDKARVWTLFSALIVLCLLPIVLLVYFIMNHMWTALLCWGLVKAIEILAMVIIVRNASDEYDYL